MKKTTIIWLILLFFASAQNNVYLRFCVSEILQGVARCDQMFSRFKAPLPLYPPRENPTADGESDLMVSCRQALQCSRVGFLFHALVCTSEECYSQHYYNSLGFLQFSVCAFLEKELPQKGEINMFISFMHAGTHETPGRDYDFIGNYLKSKISR